MLRSAELLDCQAPLGGAMWAAVQPLELVGAERGEELAFILAAVMRSLLIDRALLIGEAAARLSEARRSSVPDDAQSGRSRLRHLAGQEIGTFEQGPVAA